MITSRNISNFTSKNGSERSIVNRECYERIIRQSKKLSQLIATSWKDDDETAKKIREIFLKFNNIDPDSPAYQAMEKLLTGQTDLFGKVFEEEEIKDYLIQIDWSSFEGSVVDNPQPTTNQQPPYFIINLPYPPRPHDFNLDMQDESLLAWLEDEVNINSPGGVTNPFPPVPYLPQTTT